MNQYVVTGRHITASKMIEGGAFFLVVNARTEKEALHKVNKGKHSVAFVAEESHDPYRLRRKKQSDYSSLSLFDRHHYLQSLRP